MLIKRCYFKLMTVFNFLMSSFCDGHLIRTHCGMFQRVTDQPVHITLTVSVVWHLSLLKNTSLSLCLLYHLSVCLIYHLSVCLIYHLSVCLLYHLSLCLLYHFSLGLLYHRSLSVSFLPPLCVSPLPPLWRCRHLIKLAAFRVLVVSEYFAGPFVVRSVLA